MIATETLIGGAIGGVISLVGNYVVGRFAESHKAAVNVAAKRKERYHEKQAAAIAGVYEKLSLYDDALRGLHLYETKSLTEDQEKRTQGAIGEADRMRRDFEGYFAANEIYFPEALASRVQQVSSILRRALSTHREMARSANVGSIMEARDAARNLLHDLKGRFRELLLGKDAGLASAVSAENISARRPRIRRSRRHPGYRPARGRAGIEGDSPAQ